ncbi:hypothetical protein EVAR_61828_1 [Eumeta japonica]|uniref:Uncharacterized protein n=1 Tax=Eumeta variegata TaxID=151549 RepID=A0A4C1YWQ4_EUMVA|nr:hypothetical protein EVAR_61828_1 [Eumeta japonica]
MGVPRSCRRGPHSDKGGRRQPAAPGSSSALCVWQEEHRSVTLTWCCSCSYHLWHPPNDRRDAKSTSRWANYLYLTHIKQPRGAFGNPSENRPPRNHTLTKYGCEVTAVAVSFSVTHEPLDEKDSTAAEDERVDARAAGGARAISGHRVSPPFTRDHPPAEYVRPAIAGVAAQWFGVPIHFVPNAPPETRGTRCDRLRLRTNTNK